MNTSLFVVMCIKTHYTHAQNIEIDYQVVSYWYVYLVWDKLISVQV